MKRKNNRLLEWVLFTLFACMLSGCSLGYYSQSVIGHSKLMLSRTPINKAMRSADEKLAAQLILSQQIKAFANAELGLPETSSYNSYIDLNREFPVWTVVAAEEFSVQAKQWCYPIIGCASYRGYFKEKSANNYANKLIKRGFETTVGGASAYSTLGWFADPLLPSMMRYGDEILAETLFHEIAHQQLYINGDSEFNEAFATVVGEQGALRWLKHQGSVNLPNYQRRLQARSQFNQLLGQAKSELAVIYSGGMSDNQKRQAKVSLFAELKQRYDQLKNEQWNGVAWFDRWFDQPVNNARLAAFSTYRDRVPELERLLLDCNDDLTRFYSVYC